jgi:hypothetical protein
MQTQKFYEVQTVLRFTDDETEKIKTVREKYLITDAIDPADAYTQAYADLTKVGGTFEFEIVGVKESTILKVIDRKQTK